MPFRIQVETYSHAPSSTDRVPLLLHCASCQVKVFKVSLPTMLHSAKPVLALLLHLSTFIVIDVNSEYIIIVYYAIRQPH